MVAIVATAPLSGCMTGPHILRFSDRDPYSFHEPGSQAWWAEKAALPPGVRQTCYKGKVWPTRPRPNCDRQQYSHTFHSAHYWPYPYVCQDRSLVTGLWNDQVANGWIEETTLFEYHFDPDTDRLTRPGRNHLQWIMEIVPESRRIVFVRASVDAVRDQVRQENVRTAATELVGAAGIPAIVLRTAQPPGRPAREVQVIRTKDVLSIPVPRLSGAAGAASAGGGGAAVTQ